MKKSILLLIVSLYFNLAHSQIKEIKMFGSSLHIYGTNGQQTGNYMLQNNDEKFLGHNSQYFVIKKLNILMVYNNKGFENNNKPISLANGNEFVKITEKSIWIKNNNTIYYYDFNGSILSNYRE